MRRRWLLGVVALALVGAPVVTRRVWPRDPGPVSQELTAREIRVAGHRLGGDLTIVHGGSRTQAHRLWARYHDQTGHEGVKPRLLGVSLVHWSAPTPTLEPTGNYWLVLSDRVWNANLSGLGGSPGSYGLEIILVPEGSSSTSGNIHLT